MPTAAGRPDSTVCFDLEEMMCERERERAERPVLLNWAAPSKAAQVKEKNIQIVIVV